MAMTKSCGTRLHPSAGIALGPILFIIAILGIIAAAVAAGSGGFSGKTGGESNRSKSTVLVNVGEDLKMGVFQITTRTGINAGAIDVNADNTSTETQLFSPSGGGIRAPTPSASNMPIRDKWYFPRGSIKGLGTSADEVIAVLPISQGVCAEVNNRMFGIAAIPPALDLGDFAAGTVSGSNWPGSTSTWTSGTSATTVKGPSLIGASTGCVYNTGVELGAGCPSNCTSGPTSQYFFFQILAVQ